MLADYDMSSRYRQWLGWMMDFGGHDVRRKTALAGDKGELSNGIDSDIFYQVNAFKSWLIDELASQ